MPVDLLLRKSTQFRTFLPLNPAPMARLSSPPFGSPSTWLFAVLGTLFLAGCASTPDFSALEDDELYLRRGEEFVTDAAYLAFAYENTAEESDGDDYYDPNRSQFSPGYMNSYGMPGYQPSFYNRYRPFGGGFGNGFGTQWGLASYMNPYGAGGFGMGYGLGGYDPFYGGWGNPYSMGYGSGFGYGSPYAWNGGWGNGWNNPYGYTNWGNNTINYGAWTGAGSNDSFTSVTGRTRTPIMSYTGSNGSNYDGNGILVRPKVEAQRPDEVPAATPARTEESSPTYVSPKQSRRKRGWMQPNNSSRERSNSSRSWSSPSNNSKNSSRSRSNSFSSPSNNSGSRSGGRSSGNSRSNGSSRSSRGGGR